jgi:hypothetical protein
MGLPAPDVAGTAFGRYLRYGRRAAFGRRYFGAQRIPLFGKGKKRGSKKAAVEEETAGETAFGRLFFGRRRYRRKGVRKSRKGRKGGRKSAKPTKALVRQCRKHRIKVTRKVGSRKVYKKVSVLKKQLKRKIRLHRKKSKKSKKTVRRTRRRRSTRRSRFSLFGM